MRSDLASTALLVSLRYSQVGLHFTRICRAICVCVYKDLRCNFALGAKDTSIKAFNCLGFYLLGEYRLALIFSLKTGFPVKA